MRNIALLARRELAAYLKSPMGYIVMAVALCIEGLLFNAVSLGSSPKLSSDVLGGEWGFFWVASGIAMFSCVFISMRLLAEERQTGTLTLLLTSPIKEHEIVLGKFLSALLFFLLLTALSLYMPLLIFVNGKVSVGHIVSGYLGLTLLGSATLAIGLFGSAVGKNQLVAVVLTGALVVAMLLFWMVARISEAPLRDVLSYMALHGRHFLNFQRGVLHTRDVIFYLSVTYIFLLLTTHVLAARRWR